VDMLFMGLVYIGFIWLCASFVWGRSAEEAYESQKYDFWTKSASINKLDMTLVLCHSEWHENRSTIGIKTGGIAAASG
jgi:hypothetical protein